MFLTIYVIIESALWGLSAVKNNGENDLLIFHCYEQSKARIVNFLLS